MTYSEPYVWGKITENWVGDDLIWRKISNPDGSATDLTQASSYFFSTHQNRYIGVQAIKPELGYIQDGSVPPINNPSFALGRYWDGWNYIPVGYSGSPPTDVLELRANWEYVWHPTKMTFLLRKKRV